MIRLTLPPIIADALVTGKALTAVGSAAASLAAAGLAPLHSPESHCTPLQYTPLHPPVSHCIHLHPPEPLQPPCIPIAPSSIPLHSPTTPCTPLHPPVSHCTPPTPASPLQPLHSPSSSCIPDASHCIPLHPGFICFIYIYIFFYLFICFDLSKKRGHKALLFFSVEPSHSAASGISEKFELCGRSHFPAFNYLEDFFIAEIPEAAKITGFFTRLKTHYIIVEGHVL